MDAIDWQRKAVAEVGDDGANAVYELRLPFGVQGGTLALMVSQDLTDPLPYNASSAVIQSALEELPAVGVGGLTVNGPRKGPFYLEATGDNAGQFLPEGWLLGDGNSLVPPATLTPVMLQNGRSVSLATGAASLWSQYADKTSDYERYLWVKHDLLLGELARFAGSVDSRDNDAESKSSQRSVNLRYLLGQTKAALTELKTDAITSSTGQTTSGMIRRGQEVQQGFAQAQCDPYGNRCCR